VVLLALLPSACSSTRHCLEPRLQFGRTRIGRTPMASSQKTNCFFRAHATRLGGRGRLAVRYCQPPSRKFDHDSWVGQADGRHGRVAFIGRTRAAERVVRAARVCHDPWPRGRAADDTRGNACVACRVSRIDRRRCCRSTGQLDAGRPRSCSSRRCRSVVVLIASGQPVVAVRVERERRRRLVGMPSGRLSCPAPPAHTGRRGRS